MLQAQKKQKEVSGELNVTIEILNGFEMQAGAAAAEDVAQISVTRSPSSHATERTSSFA